MAQPLTLDEIGVAPKDAAQVIYDLRRERRDLRSRIQGLSNAGATRSNGPESSLDSSYFAGYDDAILDALEEMEEP